MKTFLIWLVIFVVLFGALSGFTHIGMTADPTKIVIAIDDSYYMKEVWPKIASRLKNKGLEGRRYTEYFVISNKEKISKDWETELDLNRFTQTRLFINEYPTGDLVDTAKYPELKQADIIYVITTSDDLAAIKKNSKAVIIKP